MDENELNFHLYIFLFLLLPYITVFYITTFHIAFYIFIFFMLLAAIAQKRKLLNHSCSIVYLLFCKRRIITYYL